jgi:peptidoglycan/LPS O-acetylase OafA/YrhL
MRSFARNPYVDYLRGLSILIVLVGHFLSQVPFAFGASVWPPLVTPMLNAYLGVSCFFVVSGFMITSRALERYGRLSQLSVAEFYSFRFARIAPCLGLVLLLALFFSWRRGPNPVHAPLRQLFYALTFRVNVYRETYGPSTLDWDILWSLSIEEVFYLGFPWFARFLSGPAVASVGLLLVVVLGPFNRHAFSGLFGYWGCFDLIALGCLTALIVEYVRTVRLRPALTMGLMVGGAVGILTVIAGDGLSRSPTWAPSLVGLSAACFLVGARFHPAPAALNPFGRALGFFGRLSYECYLFHAFVIVALLNTWRRLPVAWHERLSAASWVGLMCLMYFGLLSATAWIIGRYYAEPLNRLIRARLGSLLGRPAAPAVADASRPA